MFFAKIDGILAKEKQRLKSHNSERERMSFHSHRTVQNGAEQYSTAHECRAEQDGVAGPLVW
jgi:hypothetical protein